MDRILDSGSDDGGSNPFEDTKKDGHYDHLFYFMLNSKLTFYRLQYLILQYHNQVFVIQVKFWLYHLLIKYSFYQD